GNNNVSFIDPSPDGKAVAFGTGRGAASHIWRVDAPGPPAELTRDPGFSDRNPPWSPEGGEIAFTRHSPGGSEEGFALWIMNADGTSPRRAAEMTGAAPVWMPDGKQMVISRGDDVFRLDVASGRATP